MVLTLTPGGQPLAQSLGFTAATVVVDNFTSSYLVLTDVGKTIPPWTYGAVVSLPDGLRQANAKLVATVPAVPGPPVPLSQATLTWIDQVLPAEPGHLLQQVTTQQQTVLGQVKANAGQNVNKSFTIPAGTLAVGFAVNSGATLDTPQSVSIAGDQTGVGYFTGVMATATDGALAAALDTTDTTVTATLIGNAAKASQIDLLAWPVVAQVAIRQNPGQLPIGVVLERNDGVPIDVDSPAVGQYEVGVSMFRATPAIWQSFPFAAKINASFVAGVANRQQIIAAPTAGKFTYLYACSIGWDTVQINAGHLFDGDPNAGGTEIWAFPQGVLNPPPALLNGFKTTHAVYFYVETGVNVRGGISYNQG